MRHPLSAGEVYQPTEGYGLGPSEDAEAMYPTYDAPMVPGDGGGAGPWYACAPGGVAPGGPRFLEGVPGPDFVINQGSHSKHVIRGHATFLDPGRPRGNTGFARGPGDGELGALGTLSEGSKTALTGLLLAAAVGLVFVIYSK